MFQINMFTTSVMSPFSMLTVINNNKLYDAIDQILQYFCQCSIFQCHWNHSNQSGAVGGIIWGPFPGSWTHLGASRGLRSQKRGPYLAIFGPSLTPPANPVKFFWSKMACTGVPHIVLHVSCQTRTSGGYFRPSEVRFRAKIPLSSH